MATNLIPGQKVNGYIIRRHLNKGAFANSYEADHPRHDRVFFKQYKSPSVRKSWYKGFIAYQDEIRRRVLASSASGFVYGMIEFFEAEVGQRCYYQTFEFLDGGMDLKKWLGSSEASRRDDATWNKRVLFSRILVASLANLHAAGVVHCDLKPDNIYLVSAPGSTLGFRPKVIDVDFSVLVDRTAPWHGEQGYIGTPGYQSPEHLAAGKKPLPASDVFTTALIVYELLGRGNPYADAVGDEDKYRTVVTRHSAARLEPLGVWDKGDFAPVAEILRACLDPKPESRPTMAELENMLKSSHKSATETPTPVPPKPSPSSAHVLLLTAGDRKPIRATLELKLGNRTVRTLSEDAKYFSNEQCVFTPAPDRSGWTVAPCHSAKNNTLLNGAVLTKPANLKAGDVIAVGNPTKGTAYLPLTISFSTE